MKNNFKLNTLFVLLAILIFITTVFVKTAWANESILAKVFNLEETSSEDSTEDMSDENLISEENDESTNNEDPIINSVLDNSTYAIDTFSISNESEWSELLKKEGSFVSASNEIIINVQNDILITKSTNINKDYTNITINGNNHSIKLDQTSGNALLNVHDIPNVELELFDIVFDGQSDVATTIENKFMYLSGANVHLKANNAEIKNFNSISNYQYYYGGAIQTLNSSLNLEGGIFRNNKAAYGGGAIYGESSKINISANTVFEENICVRSGGAVYILKGELSISDAKFVGNQGGYSGGAISTMQSAVNIVSTEFDSNKAGLKGILRVELFSLNLIC